MKSFCVMRGFPLERVDLTGNVSNLYTHVWLKTPGTKAGQMRKGVGVGG